MKAIRISEFGPPSVLKLIENLDIPKPNENEVLVKVESVGVNPVDTYRRSGTFRFLPPLPWVPGSDCAGTVLERGGNTAFQPGQRVFSTSTVTGAYSSHAVVPALHLHALPDSLSFNQGAAIGTPYFTAYSALFQRGNGVAGETVLVHGASGGVGIACVQLAVARGLHVVGTAGSPQGMDLVKAAGAQHVFNHRDPDYLDCLQAQFEGKINLIVEMLADVNLVNDCNLAAKRARIMIVGNRGSLNFDPRLLMGKLLDVRGVGLFNSTEDEWQVASKEIGQLLDNGAAVPVIGREYPLEQAATAHQYVVDNSGATGKIVLQLQ